MEFKNLWDNHCSDKAEEPDQPATSGQHPCRTHRRFTEHVTSPALRQHRGPGMPGGPRLGRESSSTWPAGVASGGAGDPPGSLEQSCKPSSVAAGVGGTPRALLSGAQLSQPPA